MTCQTMDLPVLELARSHVRSASHRPWYERALETFVLPNVVGLAARWIDGKTRRMQDSAVWFIGAATELDKREPSVMIDGSGRLLTELHELEASLLELRGLYLDGAQAVARQRGVASTAGVFAESMARVSAAAADLYEAVREFRGAYQAYEANCCAVVQANASPQVLTTPEAVETALRELSN